MSLSRSRRRTVSDRILVPARPATVLSAVTAAALLVMAALVGAVSAAPTDESATVPSRVTMVDATGDRIDALVLTENLDPDRVLVQEAGEELTAATSTVRADGLATEVVFVVDADNRNVASGVLAQFLTTLDDEVASLPDSVRVAAVSAGAESDLVARLTTDRARPGDRLRAVAADQGSAMRDGIIMAADAFSDRPGVVRTVVVLAGGADTSSVGTVGEAEAALLQAGAQLVSVSVGITDEGLAQLASRTGGASLTAPLGGQSADADADGETAVDPTLDRKVLAAAVSTATTLAGDRLVVSYPSPTEGGRRPNVQLGIDDEVVAFSYPAGVLTVSPLQLVATDVGPSQDGGLLGSPIVLYLSIGLAFAAISAGLWALGSMYGGGESSLDKVLARYSDRDDTLDDDEVQEMLVQTALVQRAVAMTESFAERRGFLTRIEEMLERANLPVRAGEAMFFLSMGVLGAMGAGVVFTGSVFVAVILGIVTAGGGYAGLLMAARRRLKSFESQLPDTLQLLAGTLRAGYSLPQGLDAVSHEIDDPMGHELRRAMTEAQLGRELEDALANVADRLDSADFAWAVMAIGIQREVGGNLSEVLLTVSETMIQRERLQREVNALTAEGRVSAFILAMMPPGLGVVMYVMNPSYVGVLFSRTIGLALIGAAVVSGLIGLVWMKKVITVDA